MNVLIFTGVFIAIIQNTVKIYYKKDHKKFIFLIFNNKNCNIYNIKMHIKQI